MSGGYIIFIWIPSKKIKFSKRTVDIKPGLYVYIGSGMKNLFSRVKRHFKRGKKLHWHIDYLTEKYQIIGALVIESNTRVEDIIARYLIRKYPYIPEFGSTDTKNTSHLIYLGKDPDEFINFLKIFIDFISKNILNSSIYWFDGDEFVKVNDSRR